MAESAAAQLKRAMKAKKKMMARAGARALNRAAVSVRLDATQIMRDQLKIKSSDAKAEIQITKASVRDDLANMKAILSIKRNPIPLYQYRAQKKSVMAYSGKKVVPIFDKATRKIVYRMISGKRTGVTVQVKDQRKPVSGGFIAKMGSGKIGIWMRKGLDRTPIRQLFSTTYADIFGSFWLRFKLKRKAQQYVAENYKRELAFEEKKKAG